MAIIERKSISLIQRLEKPRGYVNPFSFGGGYKNGGLSDSAASMLKDIWSFSYMGRSEFERGAVSNALGHIWEYTSKRDAYAGMLKLEKEVYYICKIGIERDLEEVIEQLARDESRFNLKEYCGLKDAIQGKNDFVGWIDLKNYFMFFIDQEMYTKTLNLFKIK